MSEKPDVEEISGRIKKHLGHAKNENERREISIVWGGYLAALIEWGLLAVDDHGELSNMLPKVENDPVLPIFLGFDN